MSECTAMIAVESQEEKDWWAEVQQKLAAKFPEGELNWRVGQAGKKQNGQIWLKVMQYIDNRMVQDRLDEVVGVANWQNKFEHSPNGGIICSIGIRCPHNGQWIWKADGAGNTDIEAIKGGLSDSMKRAAVQWGIGRYIYGTGEQWGEVVESGGQYKGSVNVGKGQNKEYVWVEWNPPGKKSKPASPQGDGPSKPSKSSSEQESSLMQMQKFCQGVGATGPEDINLILMAIAPIGKPATTWPEFKEMNGDDQLLMLTEAKAWAKAVFEAEQEKIGSPSNLVNWLKQGEAEVAG